MQVEADLYLLQLVSSLVETIPGIHYLSIHDSVLEFRYGYGLLRTLGYFSVGIPSSLKTIYTALCVWH
jgi:hypothetical protein